MHPQPLFELFGRGVHLYGICIAVGILACIILLFRFLTLNKVPSDVQDFIYFTAIFAIILGFLSAMLFQAIYDYIANPSAGFKITGSITAMGGIAGGAAAFIAIYFGIGYFVFMKKNNIHVKYFNELFRFAPIGITVAHGFGRIGCLFAGCCHGAYLGPDPVAGGLYMQGTVYSEALGEYVTKWGYYVPTQLYEAIFLFVLAGILTFLYFKKRFNCTMIVYLIAYGVWRFVIEFFRTDYRGGTAGLTPSQWQSFIFIGIAVALIVVYKIKKYPVCLPPIDRDGDENKSIK